ncbi:MULTISPECIES: methyltransferase [Arthrobacter]|uniref:Methyltransferase n=2 Tax=Arthrobacter TaxID=1663 RepID=A0ABU9KL87_9MICC|nr:methyltransferase [Arthrobacter sp. YJM1]MDP5227562.1 methyltransferase [Arthrobacter sp. YJM1]
MSETARPALTPDIPRSDDLPLLQALHADLTSVDFTADAVAELLGDAASEALSRDQLIPARIALEPHAQEPLAVVVGLWLLARPQAAEALDAALPRTGTAGLERLGLVERDDAGAVRAAVDLRPYAFSDEAAETRLWVASDLGAHQRPGVLRHDHVLGIGQASTTLVQITLRAPVDRALDLGTGCGIQAFHLLRHARHVTATDISERALAFTRFNLLLNAGALELDPAALDDRVSLRLGSLLEPVAGERFNQVVSNPPFVITPRHAGENEDEQFTYRDGGLPGDAIVSALFRELPGVLEPGGTAQMLGNWEITEGAGWEDRLRAWLPDGAGAWVIQREQLGPEQYAETWLRDASEGRDPELYARSYRDYLQDFAGRAVGAIGFGMVLLQAPGEFPLRRFEEITYPVEQPLGPHLLAALGRRAWLAGHELAEEALVVAEDVTEERHQRPGAEHPGVILLRQGAGLRRTTLLSSELAGFVSACDGDFTAGQLAAAVVSLTPGPEEISDADRVAALLDEVANLVLDGFLIPGA